MGQEFDLGGQEAVAIVLDDFADRFDGSAGDQEAGGHGVEDAAAGDVGVGGDEENVRRGGQSCSRE